MIFPQSADSRECAGQGEPLSSGDSLLDERALLNDLLATSPDYIYFKDRKSRFIRVNPALAKMLGCNMESIIGKTDFDFFGDEHAQQAFADEQRIMETGIGVVGQEERETWSDGSVTWASSTKVARLGADGTVVGLIGISRDITDRKKLEQQFLRTQRMEGIGTLAGGIAHDLNNVLAPITMSIAVLKEEVSPENRASILTTIESSAARGAAMIQQVLSFARGVEGQRVTVPIKNIIRDVEKIANDTFFKNIRVSTATSEDLWNITGDPTQIHQVLLNLAVNARDAMPDGGTLTIASENSHIDETYAAHELDSKPGDYVVIRVEDTGTGMSQEIVNKIFEPFFTTKELGKGSGLGLSTTIGIIRSHEGFIRVESELGKGTSFTIYLPADPHSNDVVNRPTGGILPKGNGELILVIDDEEAIRKIMQQTLVAFGYEVLAAGDGAEGVSIFAAHKEKISLVVTDMMMPVLDGCATVQILKKINPQLRVIGASGIATIERMEQARRVGIGRFLPKPFTAEALLQAVRKSLDENDQATLVGRKS